MGGRWMFWHQLLEHCERGDLIEIDRTTYYHWCVYIGQGDVVHLTGLDDNTKPDSKPSLSSSASSASVLGETALVRRQHLREVARNDRCRVNNKWDAKHEPLEPDEIVAMAVSCVGQEMRYDVVGRNCEHFVTASRYGRSGGFSDQANNAVAAVGGVTGGLIIGFLLSMFFGRR
ncbi:phospholipase A and acyltransferase 1-like [Branchiostoma floridae x Branchiostoma japonicum]